MVAGAAAEARAQPARAVRASVAAFVLAVVLVAFICVARGDRIHTYALKQLNFLNNYSVRTDPLEKKLEQYRIERDIALAHMGHPSLTEVPQQSPKRQREELKKLKMHALAKLHRLSRGRHAGEFGLKDGDPLQAAAVPDDCDPGDERLGLCGVDVPSPAKEELSDAEEKVSKDLTAKEEKSDAERNAIIAQIDKQRIEKAQTLMKKLTETDRRINELVHHAVKVAGMAPHTPDP